MSSPEHAECEHFEERNSKFHSGILLLTQAYHMETIGACTNLFWPVFLAQKLTKLEHFKENLSNFSKKISQIQNINLWNVFGVTMITFAIKLNNFGSIWLWNDLFGLKCHIPMFQSPVCTPPPPPPTRRVERNFSKTEANWPEIWSSWSGIVVRVWPGWSYQIDLNNGPYKLI